MALKCLGMSLLCLLLKRSSEGCSLALCTTRSQILDDCKCRSSPSRTYLWLQSNTVQTLSMWQCQTGWYARVTLITNTEASWTDTFRRVVCCNEDWVHCTGVAHRHVAAEHSRQMLSCICVLIASRHSTEDDSTASIRKMYTFIN